MADPSNAATAAASSVKRITNPVLFICDIQTRFRPAIHSYPSVISTASKLLRAASILSIPIVNTTQSRAKLGQTCEELGISPSPSASLSPLLLCDVDKTRFSMFVSPVDAALASLSKSSLKSNGPRGLDGVDVNSDTSLAEQTSEMKTLDIIIVGIETHICVLQTTLDALQRGHRVWVCADGVSSCNEGERGPALERMRQEGARVTTSESLVHEILRDAGDERFKEVSALVKETKKETAESVGLLCRF